jgi:hypothetical protein
MELPVLHFLSWVARLGFIFSGFVNVQLVCHWNTENRHTLCKVQFHDQKVNNNWAYVFVQYDSVGALYEQYFGAILWNVHCSREAVSVLEHDNASAHASQHSREDLHEIIGESVISQGLWLPRSPYISLCSIFRCGETWSKNCTRTKFVL